MPMNSNGVSSTGNVIFDPLHNFPLECGARIHRLRGAKQMKEATGRKVCGYVLVRGSVHAHAYALALNYEDGLAECTRVHLSQRVTPTEISNNFIRHPESETRLILCRYNVDRAAVRLRNLVRDVQTQS
jgi:Mn-containing catalase